jgi:hypothetical protein
MGNFEFAYMLDGSQGVPAVHKFPVAATQTLEIGDLVLLSSGKVAKAAASIADVLGVMAEDSASQAEGTMVKVYPILPGQVWKATADAAATSVVLTSKLIDINSDQTVDVGDTTNGCISVLKTGTTSTEVYVTFTEFALC